MSVSTADNRAVDRDDSQGGTQHLTGTAIGETSSSEIFDTHNLFPCLDGDLPRIDVNRFLTHSQSHPGPNP